MSFTIPSSGERSGGRVFTFPSREALDPVSEYYEEFGGVFASYVYVEGNVLVQIDGDVPEIKPTSTAKSYERREDRGGC